MTSQYEVFDETLKGKLLNDILEIKEVKALDDYLVRRITDGFREPYVRLLVSKLPTLEEQTEFLERVVNVVSGDYDMPEIDNSYYSYLIDLEIELKGKRRKLEPAPALLSAAHVSSHREGFVKCVCGEWALVEGPTLTYASNWVENYDFTLRRENIEDDFRAIYDKEWGSTSTLKDLVKLIESNPRELHIDVVALARVSSIEADYVLFVAYKEPSEEHVSKRERILNSYKRYFDAPSLPRPQEDTAELQSRCDTLKAENAALRQRCEALEAEVESLNANRPSRSSALTDALKSFFKDENEDVESFLNSIEGKDGEEVTDYVRSVFRAGRIKDKMHSSPLYYTLHSHGYYTKSKQNWDQQLAKK